MDALCNRFNIDNSKREKHNALVDCELLKEVYINLIDQKEPKLNLESVGISEIKTSIDNINIKKNNKVRKIIKPSEKELKFHNDYLKNQLKKNNYI